MDATLTRFGSAVPSVFTLSGSDENSATAAVGWTLSKSPAFRHLFAKGLFGDFPRIGEGLRIELQRFGSDKGFTDIELHGHSLHAIIEAKRGLDLPGVAQLQKYASRIGSVDRKLLVSISAAPGHYAQRNLPARVDGIPVVHRSWRDVVSLVRDAARKSASPIEKLWLHELESHLGDYVSTRRITDNTVFVVSLSTDEIINGSGYTWIDVVKDGYYFHPVGNRWPTEPPNYIGFRYHGRLQSVHYVKEWSIPGNLRDVNSKWPDSTDHFVYTLGPAMNPPKEMRSGPIWQMRGYAAIDLLLSGACRTVHEAFEKTLERLTQE